MTKFALLIGVSTYKDDSLEDLPAARNDVEAMHRILVDPDLGDFKTTIISEEKEQEPTQIKKIIETKFKRLGRGDTFLFYFSGHGIRNDNGELFFATPYTEKDNNELITSTAISASFIHEKMNASKARKQIVILDCCYSGAFDPSLQQKDDGIVDFGGLIGTKEKDKVPAEGRVVLTSSSSIDQSFTQKKTQSSIYTNILVQAIESGDADLNNDGRITAQELNDYIEEKIKDELPSASPKIIVLKDKGYDLEFTKVKQSKSTSVINSSLDFGEVKIHSMPFKSDELSVEAIPSILRPLEAFISKYYKNELLKGILFFVAIGLTYVLLVLIIEYFLWLKKLGRGLPFWSCVGLELVLRSL